MPEGRLPSLKPPLSERDWTRGPWDAPVTLVEYVDFQCPCCQGSYATVERVLSGREGAVRFAVRHFPVRSVHRYAEGAALAAEAAGRQGKFWEMYHALLQPRGRIAPEDLEFHARQLDLDLDRFHRDLESEELRAKLLEDKQWALRSGLNATPTLFINGLRYDHRSCPVKEEELHEALEAARREATLPLAA
jgi:protein-disulfide isomerase